MKSVIIILIGVLNFTLAVNREVFKTCDQSSFCRRCRYQNATNFEVRSETLFTDSTNIVVEILNQDNGHLFLLTLGALEDNTFRFEIDEKSPIKPRYRVTEALQTLQHAIIDVSMSSDRITVNSKANKAVINLSPFRISFYRNEILTLSFNSRNLMKFEHYRNKPTTPDPNEEAGTWEENFGTFTDTKPNGPEAVAGDFIFHNSEVLFGIPEHADSFALKPTVDGEPYRLYNLDVFEYELESPMSLYGAVPIMYGHGNGTTAGVFWHNAAETFIDIHNEQSAYFMSEAGIIDVFVVLGPTPNDAFAQYTKLTGVGNLPQLFALAHHQCRWNYFFQQDVLDVVNNFDIYDIPLDTIWLDIEYTNDKMYFTWNYTGFPDPLAMINQLRLSGRHLTYIIDPHTKTQALYPYYTENTNRGYFVKNKDGSDFVGYCWPGDSSYVDYFNPEARRFYGDQFLMQNFAENAIDTGLWNDMNEPSVFDGPEVTMPKDNIHYGGWEHRQLHNIFGLMHVKGSFDGLMRRGNGSLRPFILTRSFFAGSQRYAAIWTGDNFSEWPHLKSSIKMCLSVSVAGISFCGSDIGGFFGNPETELLVRWYQAAVYQPFFRAHAHMDSDRREPYLLPETSRAAAHKAIKTRYALLSLWYTMFYEHERYGKPVMRPMLAEYPLDKNSFKMDDQYMLSDILLVHPVLEKAASSVNVYFPSVDGYQETDWWYDLDDYTKINSVGFKTIQVDSLKIPVYQKGGSIIPKKETERSASMYMTNDPVSIFVAVDRQSKAKGTLFIDDEKSFDYRRGRYLYLQFEFNENTLTSRRIDEETNYQTGSKLGRIVIAGLEHAPTYATIEFSNEEPKRLEIINITDEYFEIAASNTSLTSEWKITLNGATQNIVCTSLFVISLLLAFFGNI